MGVIILTILAVALVVFDAYLVIRCFKMEGNDDYSDRNNDSGDF